MLSTQDINNVRFAKSGRQGYLAEEVDEFLEKVEKTVEELHTQNADLVSKIKLLADKVSEYRQKEQSITAALVSAQETAEKTISGAQSKAEEILKNANSEASKIKLEAQSKITTEQATLDALRESVRKFRSEILAKYKEHLRMINSLNAATRLPEVAQSANETEQNDQAPSEESEPSKFQELNFGKDYDLDSQG